MTEHTDPQHQTVTLDNADTAAIFVEATETEPARVFYDLGILTAFITKALVRKVIQHADLDNEERAYLLGQTDLVQHIANQRDSLLAQHTLATGNTLADFGFIGENGTLS